MTMFDAANASVDANNVSMNAQSMLEDALNGIAGTPLAGLVACTPRAAGALRDAAQRYDGQVLPAAAVLNDQLEHCTGASSNECVWSGAGGEP